MNTSQFISKLFLKDPVLAWAGTINLIGFAVVFIISLFDSRIITGAGAWVKPMKFFLSVAIYLYTMCYIISYLPGNVKWLSWSVAVFLCLENVFISMQAARGTTSHFNTSTAFDGAVFTIMGIAIFLNTVLCIYVLFQYFAADIKISETLLWGIRAGLLIFILASFEGMFIASKGAHSVGVPDGGRGLPFLNWSREGGDLRIAHFVGLHALQVLPIAGVFVKTVPAIIIISIIYFLISLALFIQAVKGRAFV